MEKPEVYQPGPPDMVGFSTQQVIVTKGRGTGDEWRVALHGQLVRGGGHFHIQAPIDVGDLVEIGLSPGRVRTAVVDDVHSSGHRLATPYLVVSWGDPDSVTRPEAEEMLLRGLHPAVVASSAGMFRDGHSDDAVASAFRAVEERTRVLTGVDESGAALVGRALGKSGVLDVRVFEGETGRNEQEGWEAIFRGSARAVRNVSHHQTGSFVHRETALELLALASLLHRRLDVAEANAVQ